MENWLVSSVEEVFKNMKKVSSFYATTITFAMSTTTMHCSKLSIVLHVTHFFQKPGNWEDTWLLVVNVLNIFTQKCLWTERNAFWKFGCIQHPIKKWAKTVQELGNNWLNPFVSGKTHTSKLKLQHGLGSMCLYQFLFRQTWYQKSFFSATPNLIISSRLSSPLSKG